MKKLLTGLLAVLTCFTCATAVACGDNKGNNNNNSNSESTNPSIPEELQTAAEYLEEMYRSKYAETRVDFEVLSAIMGYPITWSVNVTEGVQVVVADSKVTIDVDEHLNADLDYVLTALITDEAGNTTTVSFNRKVLKEPQLIPSAITEAPEEGVAYKFYLYQGNTSKDLYFTGSMNGFYYQTTESLEEAVDIYAEYKEGSTTEFYLYFNHATDGKQYMGVEEGWNSKNSYWTFNVVYKATPFTFVWSSELNTAITTVACRSAADNKNQDAEQTTTQTMYIGTYKTYNTFSASSIDKAEGSFVGQLAKIVDKSTITPESKVEESKEALTLSFTEVAGAKEMELPVARHTDVAVTWAVSENAYASIVDGKLVTTNPEADVEVVLTATLTCGEVSATKEFTVTLKFASDLPAFDTEITIPQANAIGEAQAANVLTEGKYYVSGTVTEVKNTQYGNLYIEDAEGNKLYVYGCYNADGTVRYDAMENAPQVGDTVKLYSAITSYNGSAQLKNAWVVEWTAGSGSEGGDTDEPVTPPAGEVTWTAAVPEAGKPYIFGMTQANVNNTVYYLAGGMDGFYMATTTDPNAAIETYIEATTGGYYFYTYVGETKTYINMVVSGTHVNGAYEATASTVYTIDETNKTLIAVVNDAEYWFATRNDKTYTTMGPCAVSYAGFFGVFYTNGQAGGEVTPPAGGEDPVDPPVGGEAPEVPEAITTIAGALAGKEGDAATFSGMVSEIYQAWNSQYSNMSFYVTDGTDRILVFRAGTQVGIGDQVSVAGTVTMYNEVAQIAQGATVTITEKHVCSTFTEADCNNPAYCTVCEKANGTALEHVDTNSDNICDNCETNLAVTTTTASKTVAELITEYGWTSSTTKQEFKLDDNVTVKVNGGNNTGKAYNGDHIRIYATDSPAGTLTITVPEGYELVSVKITTQTGTYAFLYVDGGSTDICNVKTAVSGQSVVLNSVKNGSDGKQVRVMAIEVEYAPAN